MRSSMELPVAFPRANGQWLPLAFASLMGLAMLIYAVLDGYDLGVGMLIPLAEEDEKDRMIASIGPFWDANETWLVLGVGLLLVAFPAAHGVILTNLYLPVAIMLLGFIMRGVAFAFRTKGPSVQRPPAACGGFGGKVLKCGVWLRKVSISALLAAVAASGRPLPMGLPVTAMSGVKPKTS